MPKPEIALPNVRRTHATVNDGTLMSCGVLAFGISIPFLSGLYGTIAPPDPRFFGGAAWFIALAAAIWLGNRWLLFKQRQHFDWFNNPVHKLFMLVAANVLYTAPLTFFWLAGWYLGIGLSPNIGIIRDVILTNVICVIFVTHAYETAFLINERESDLMQVERLERSRTEAELSALKTQIDPHFLFNCLNTLGHLIVHDNGGARVFCDGLADVYRYVLASRSRHLVPLSDELSFVASYLRLLELRFGGALACSLPVVDPADMRLIPPLSIQVLLENAVKHNQLRDGDPLQVRIVVTERSVQVDNPIVLRTSAQPYSGTGLKNLDDRCRLTMGSGLEIEQRPAHFSVRISLVVA